MKFPVKTIPYNIKMKVLIELVGEKFKRYTVNKKLYFEIPKDMLIDEYKNSNVKIILTGSEMGK